MMQNNSKLRKHASLELPTFKIESLNGWYSGGRKEQKATGFGRLFRDDGSIKYKGDFLENKYHGEGITY